MHPSPYQIMFEARMQVCPNLLINHMKKRLFRNYYIDEITKKVHCAMGIKYLLRYKDFICISFKKTKNTLVLKFSLNTDLKAGICFGEAHAGGFKKEKIPQSRICPAP